MYSAYESTSGCSTDENVIGSFLVEDIKASDSRSNKGFYKKNGAMNCSSFVSSRDGAAEAANKLWPALLASGNYPGTGNTLTPHVRLSFLGSISSVLASQHTDMDES